MHIHQSVIYTALLTSLVTTSAFSLALPRIFVRDPPSSSSSSPLAAPATQHEQATLPQLPIINMGGSGSVMKLFKGDNEKTSASALSISDILPKNRRINIFASLTRDVASLSSRLESNDPSDNTTLLAPLNSAMQALPRKPWEDRPGEVRAGEVGAARDESRAERNLQKFVEEHVVPVSPWVEGEEGKIKTLGGGELWWEWRGEEQEGEERKRVVMPGEVEVDEVIGKVGNGEVWALKSVVNYA